MHDHMYEVHDSVRRQHVEHENGVRHEVQAVVISKHDVMEQVDEIHVRQNVQLLHQVQHDHIVVHE